MISHGLKKRVKITIASVPTAEQRSQEDDVKDHVKQTWEKIKIDLTSDDDDDDIEPGDDDVEMKSPPDESQQGNDDVGQKSDADELKSHKRDFREQDEVDDFLNEEREKAETVEEEGADDGLINIEEYEADEARDAHMVYPAWMNRIEFGSKVLPSEPCTIGDAQPELIKILLLQTGNNLLKIYKKFHRNFCDTILSLLGNNFKGILSSGWILIRKYRILVKTMMETSLNPLMNRCRNFSDKSANLTPKTMWEKRASSMHITDP